eukprot:767138-Hanusia_phi.AAC.5
MRIGGRILVLWGLVAALVMAGGWRGGGEDRGGLAWQLCLRQDGERVRPAVVFSRYQGLTHFDCPEQRGMVRESCMGQKSCWKLTGELADDKRYEFQTWSQAKQTCIFLRGGKSTKKLAKPGLKVRPGMEIGTRHGSIKVGSQAALLEYKKRKRLKQVRRKQRQEREEILRSKQERKEIGILSAIALSARLRDEDTLNDLLRLKKAAKKFLKDSLVNETTAAEEFERALWVPPRVREPSGASESLIALPWDFEDTPENRRARREYRKLHNISKYKGLFCELDEYERMEDDDSTEEVSAPDFDKAIYFDRSIYENPEGDKKNPHRVGASWGKEVLERLGAEVVSQTSLDMDRPLVFDPLEEGCVLPRETLEEQKYHFVKKLGYRWAQRYPRYREFLKREIKRLDILIPEARPMDVPEDEWVPPRECVRFLRDGTIAVPRSVNLEDEQVRGKEERRRCTGKQ